MFIEQHNFGIEKRVTLEGIMGQCYMLDTNLRASYVKATLGPYLLTQMEKDKITICMCMERADGRDEDAQGVYIFGKRSHQNISHL